MHLSYPKFPRHAIALQFAPPQGDSARQLAPSLLAFERFRFQEIFSRIAQFDQRCQRLDHHYPCPKQTQSACFDGGSLNSHLGTEADGIVVSI